MKYVSYYILCLKQYHRKELFRLITKINKVWNQSAIK